MYTQIFLESEKWYTSSCFIQKMLEVIVFSNILHNTRFFFPELMFEDAKEWDIQTTAGWIDPGINLDNLHPHRTQKNWC